MSTMTQSHDVPDPVTGSQLELLRAWFPDEDGGIPWVILRSRSSANRYIVSRLEGDWRRKRARIAQKCKCKTATIEE